LDVSDTVTLGASRVVGRFDSTSLTTICSGGLMARKNSPKIPPASRRASLKISGGAWQVQTAKARFSELFRRARTEGPQIITRQGKESVVMMPLEQFDQIIARARQPKSLVQFFRQSPLAGLELEFERDQDRGRDVHICADFFSTQTAFPSWYGLSQSRE
jgi:antitoxin Phd